MKTLVLSTTACLMMSLPVSAAVIDAITVTANVSLNGTGPLDVNSGPFATANLTQTLGGTLPDTYTGSAFQRDNGFSQIETKVSHSGFDGIAANGELTENTGRVSATRKVRYTNTSTTTAYAGTFEYNLRGMYLEVFNGGGGPTIPKAELAFVITATNGAQETGNATLTGAYNDFKLDTSGIFSGALNLTDCFGSTCQGANTSLADFGDAISLGVLAPGESVEVSTFLFANNVWNGTEIGSLVRAIDPNGATSYNATFTTVGNPSPVPLPASGLMLLAAMAGGLGLRRFAITHGTG